MRPPLHTLIVLAAATAILAAPALAGAQDEEQAPAEPPADSPEEAPAEAPAESPAAADREEDEEEDEEEEEDDYHEGFFFRFALGLGWGWISGDGTMTPAKGLQLVEDPTHNSPVFNFTLSLGGGFLDLGLHLGVLYERMILRSDEPIEMGITLMGIGGGATYYFTDNDFFVTAQVRLIGLLMFMPGVICDRYFSDKFEWYRGPGFSVTLGKEWYGDDDGGIGLGIQGNYAYLMHASEFAFHYGSLLLVLTLTRF